MTVLELKNIEKTYGDKIKTKVLHNINLKISSYNIEVRKLLHCSDK